MAHGLALDHAAWASPWRTRSVRDKGILCLGLLACAVALPVWPGAAAVAVISLALLLGPIRVGLRRLAMVLWLPAASILIGVASVAVSVGFDGGLRVGVTRAGLLAAGSLALRALAATLAMFTLACSTPMVDVFAGLRRAGIPTVLVEIAALIYRFTFGLIESAAAVHAAQEARLGYVNRRAALRSASMGVAALFVRAWERARRLDEGLAGRGYTDSLTTLEPARRRSMAFVGASVGVLLVIVLASLLGWAR